MERRTDLALEAREIFGEDIKGVKFEESEKEDIKVSRLKITSDKASAKLGKEKGTYVTLEMPPLSDNYKTPDEKLPCLSEGNSQ